ncbi:Glutathione S-transferase 4 [Smittium culicis]|uniref:Glutathione S-transferase 4 n=1 Tax=Smittium culicis TaxID=133412 RepID=A0A1R1XLQ5_9FUNG|nr:Glutathione S-transferase 4 [Smittium culicis]
MSKFELVYFPFNGLALASKLMLSLGGANRKLSIPDWPTENPINPYGKHPELIETKQDGYELILNERRDIEEYLAGKLGFLPKNRKQLYQCSDYVNEIFQYGEFFGRLDVDIKTGYDLEAEKKLLEKGVNTKEEIIAYKKELEKLQFFRYFLADTTRFLCSQEKHLSQSISGYYIGDTATYADIAICSIYSEIKSHGLSYIFDIAKYPHVKKLIEILEPNSAVGAVIKTQTFALN